MHNIINNNITLQQNIPVKDTKIVVILICYLKEKVLKISKIIIYNTCYICNTSSLKYIILFLRIRILHLRNFFLYTLWWDISVLLLNLREFIVWHFAVNIIFLLWYFLSKCNSYCALIFFHFVCILKKWLLH